jgi:hypothetical protein
MWALAGADAGQERLSFLLFHAVLGERFRVLSAKPKSTV